MLMILLSDSKQSRFEKKIVYRITFPAGIKPVSYYSEAVGKPDNELFNN